MSVQFEDHEVPVKHHTGLWIPVELTQFGLSKTEEHLLATIHALTGPAPKYCFASNEFLAKEMNLSESRVSFYITKLKRMGLIEQVSYDGRRRILRSCPEQWYRRPEKPKENSNKVLCVKPRIPTTRTHAVRDRDSTQHIIQSYKTVEVDDDDEAETAVSNFSSVENVHKSDPKKPKQKFDDERVNPQPSFEGKTDFKDSSLVKDDFYAYSLRARKDWSAEEIELAWKRFSSVRSPISDPYNYFERIIENNRNTQNSKIAKKQYIPRDKKCQKTSNTLETQKKKQENSNSNSSETATLTPALAALIAQHKLK